MDRSLSTKSIQIFVFFFNFVIPKWQLFAMILSINCIQRIYIFFSKRHRFLWLRLNIMNCDEEEQKLKILMISFDFVSTICRKSNKVERCSRRLYFYYSSNYMSNWIISIIFHKLSNSKSHMERLSFINETIRSLCSTY